MLKWMKRLFVRRYSTVGIEWNDDYVKIVELRFNRNSRPKIKKISITPLPQGVIEDGVIIDEEQLTSIVRSVVDQHHLNKKETHIVLTGTSVIVRGMSAPPNVSDRILCKWLDFEINHRIFLPIKSPVYDYIKLKPTSTVQAELETPRPEPYANELNAAFKEVAAASESVELSLQQETKPLEPNILLIAAARETVETYGRILKSADLKMSSIEMKSLSAYRLFSTVHLTHREDTFLYVDIQQSSSDFALYHEGEVRLTRNVNLSFLHEHFNDACEHLADELERLIDFFRYSLRLRNQTFQYVLVSGDIERLDECVALLNVMMDIEVRLVTAKQISDASLLMPGLEHLFPAVVTPIGLALRGKRA